MMKTNPAFYLAALSLLTGADAAAKTHPRWMIGRWAWVSPTETLARGDCPESEIYGRNGCVTAGDDVSRWWVDGSYLVRVTVRAGYGGPVSEVGRIYRRRFTRVGRDKLVFQGDESVQWLVRGEDVPPENK